MKKNLISLIIVFVLCFSANAFSQTCQWAESITNNVYSGSSTTVNSNGDIYVYGNYYGGAINFNNGISIDTGNSYDIYLAKYNSNGLCQWAQRIWGDSQEESSDMAIDSEGNIYLIGSFTSTQINFNNNISLNSYGNFDSFIAKYNPDGICQWAERIGGTDYDGITCIDVDSYGNIFVGGYFNSPTLNFNNSLTLNFTGQIFYFNTYLAKYNVDGSCLWVKKIESTTTYNYIQDISVDVNGNIIITGGMNNNESTNFGNDISLTSNNYRTGYLAFYLGYDGTCYWAQGIYGNSNVEPFALSVDNNNNIFIVGNTFWGQLTFNNGVQIDNTFGFLAKYNIAGSCQWAQSVTGLQCPPKGIATDRTGNIYVSGSHPGTVIFNNDISINYTVWGEHGYIAKYNGSGLCQWAENIINGGTGPNSQATASNKSNLAISNSNEILAFAYKISSNDTTFFNNGKYSIGSNYTAYLAKYSQGGYKSGKTLWGWEQWNPEIVKVGNDKDWVSVSQFKEFYYSGIKNDGTLWSSLFGEFTQLGTDNDWKKVVWGYQHALALKNDGTLWAWGSNSYGQLGLGYDGGDFIQLPTQVGTSNDWVYVFAGIYHSFAIKSNGTLWAWGSNYQGQLGDGTDILRNAPVQIGTDDDWVKISAGYDHTIGLKNDGTMWNWGYGTMSVPLQLGTETNWVSIATGAFHNLALKSNGTLWAWGQNSSGQLGDGTTVDKTTPVQIGGLNEWKTITCGWDNSAAIKTDGTLWNWGWNILSPEQKGDENNWADVAAGMLVIALKDEIILNEGWNLTSSNILPNQPNLESIFFDNDDIVIIKNNLGSIYYPEFGLNQIGNWESTQAYQIYVNSKTSIKILGEEVNPSNIEINLNQGWNLVPYIRKNSMPIQLALGNNLNNLVFVKDNLGNYYWPSLNINTIMDLVPGQGYWFYMSAPEVLVYPGN